MTLRASVSAANLDDLRSSSPRGSSQVKEFQNGHGFRRVRRCRCPEQHLTLMLAIYLKSGDSADASY
jgi:hypothetical protein